MTTKTISILDIMSDVLVRDPELSAQKMLAEGMLSPADLHITVPTFDPELHSLIEFCGGPRELFMSWLEGHKVRCATPVRNVMKARVLGSTKGRKGRNKNLSALGL